MSKYFIFHGRICQIYKLEVRRMERSVCFLFVLVTLTFVISDLGICFHNFVYLSSGFDFFLHFWF